MTYVPVYGPCCRLVLIKSFVYRAEADEEFSSGYTFAPINTPSTDAQWESFALALRGYERPIYPSSVKWHRAYGYTSNEPQTAHAFVIDWEASADVQTGTFVPAATDVIGAGDQAALVQWRNTVKSVKGKPIYHRKYCHDPFISAGGGNAIATDYSAALQTYANQIAVYLGGPYSTKYPTGHVIQGTVSPFVTTRTLKRRGKRPLTQQTHSSASGAATLSTST